MCVSHKFNALCEEAKQFAKQVNDEEVHPVNPFISGGAVAQLLALLHRGSVRSHAVLLQIDCLTSMQGLRCTGTAGSSARGAVTRR